MSIAYSIDTYNQAAEKEMMGAIRTNGGGDCIPKVVYSIENHPNDSRVKLSEDNKVQALTTRMGTGGGNVPIVLSVDFSHADDVVRIGGGDSNPNKQNIQRR